MNILTSKAMVAKVNFGFVEIEGLLLPDENYAIAASQLMRVLNPNSARQDNSSRDVKAILGKDYQPVKACSELNSNKVNVLTLEQAKKIIRELDKKGNKTAQALVDALVLEGIERRFDAAFGKKIDEEKRNLWLKARVEGKTARRSLTDAVQDYLLRHNHDPKGNYAKFQVYAKFTDAINCAVLGKTAKELKDELKMTASQVLRDEVDCPELSKIKEIERYAAILIDKQDTHPVEAVEQAILFYS